MKKLSLWEQLKILQIEKKSLQSKKQKIDKNDEKKLLEKIISKYKKQTSPYYAAANLWIDAIIDPIDTRKIISLGIDIANHSPISEKYNPGIIQS